ncbi:MAG: glycosyltransferase family 4 protein [Candidatus Roizmanbacteria bacterium]|nr:glycosyltransferase family 4 protein [Candidatus Roizmanbacteria bacterium]
MNIAIAGVISKPIVESPFGGTEAFTYLLIKGLVELGHNVTLYCGKGSKTYAQNHIFICDPKSATIVSSNVEFIYPYTLLEIKKILIDTKTNRYDILHVNFLKTFMLSYFSSEIPLPILHTIHRDFFELQEFCDLYNTIGIGKNENFCFVSKNALRKSLFKKNVHVVYNGIDIDKYYPSNKKAYPNYLWLSRIDPLKGPHVAIQAASKLGIKLILSGDIDRAKYQTFFDSSIKPLLNNRMQYEAALGFDRKLELYQTAKAFIFPIQWEEPFGLVIVEALSCGTPVITFRRGAMSELITDGENGFLVDPERGELGIIDAIKKIESLPEKEYEQMRQNCRASVVKKFSYKTMAANYISLYEKLIKESRVSTKT